MPGFIHAAGSQAALTKSALVTSSGIVTTASTRTGVALDKGKTMRIAKLTAITLVLLGLLSSFALAADTLKFKGMGPSVTNWIWYKDTTVKSENVYVGVINVSVNDSPTSQRMLCIDLFHNLYSRADGWKANLRVGSPTVPGAISSRAWDKVAWVTEEYLPKVSTNEDGARLQALVWEILRDDPGSLNTLTGGSSSMSDNFRLGGVPAWASDTRMTEMFNYATTASVGYGKLHYWYEDDPVLPTSQNLILIGALKPTGAPVVPEIPAAALAPLGLAAFGLIRRRIAR